MYNVNFVAVSKVDALAKLSAAKAGVPAPVVAAVTGQIQALKEGPVTVAVSGNTPGDARVSVLSSPDRLPTTPVPEPVRVPVPEAKVLPVPEPAPVPPQPVAAGPLPAAGPVRGSDTQGNNPGNFIPPGTR